mmetsp:Transcript_1034/g.2230  ORF Transcript_1034/g.2230 Transcript_1034/m.2230 type:complete len:305 (-) Transcript_1034:103-1017(-)
MEGGNRNGNSATVVDVLEVDAGRLKRISAKIARRRSETALLKQQGEGNKGSDSDNSSREGPQKRPSKLANGKPGKKRKVSEDSDDSNSSSTTSSSSSSSSTKPARPVVQAASPPSSPVTEVCFGWESAAAGRVSAAMVAAAAAAAASNASPIATAAEVEKFLAENPGVDRETSQRLRMLSTNYQKLVIERGSLKGLRNPSTALGNRITDVEQGRIAAAPRPGEDGFIAPGGATKIEKMIKDNALNATAAGILRALPPEKVKMALALKFENVRDPSALVMQTLLHHAQKPEQFDGSQALVQVKSR